jgi:hypothetical protein
LTIAAPDMSCSRGVGSQNKPPGNPVIRRELRRIK